MVTSSGGRGRRGVRRPGVPTPEPGKRPRVTLTPSLALKDGKPFLSFSLPGGDVQDQFLLQLFLNVVEFGMDVQQAAEAPKFESFQMQSSFSTHEIQPGRLVLDTRIPQATFDAMTAKGYKVECAKSSVNGEHAGAVTAIAFDQENGTFMVRRACRTPPGAARATGLRGRRLRFGPRRVLWSRLKNQTFPARLDRATKPCDDARPARVQSHDFCGRI